MSYPPEVVDAIRRRRGFRPMWPPDPLDLADVPARPELNPGLPEDAISGVGEVPAADPADVAQVTADLEQQEQARPSSVPVQVGQAVTGQLPQPVEKSSVDEDELYAARDTDRQSRNAGRMELAAKQLVAGVTQTPQAQVSQQAPARAPQVAAEQKSRRQQLVEELERKRQGERDKATDGENRSQAELRSAQVEEILLKRRGGGNGGELEGAKAVFAQRYPEHAALIAQVPSMKVLQDLQNSLDSESGRKTTIDAARITAAGAKVERKETKTDQQVADLAKASGADVAMARKALDEVDSAISAGGGTAPGTGTIKSRAPDWLLSDEGNKVRQNALDALAIMLTVRSGATVSPEELERSKGIYGLNASPERFAEGMKRLRRDFETALTAKQAGYGPEVKKKFVEQGGAVAGKIRMTNGKETLMVDAADVEAAKADGFKAAQ